MNANTTTTGRVRMSYVHLSKPHANQPGQDEKYSMSVLVPKTDLATKQAIDAAIEAAVQNGITNKWNGTRPAKISTTVYDGDAERPKSGEPFGPECKGHWVINCSARADRPPFVVNEFGQTVIGQDNIAKLIVSGDYGRVNISFYPYNSNGNRGIGCGLNGVQFLEKGEPLGGGVTAEEAFGTPTAPGYTTPADPAFAPGNWGTPAPDYTNPWG